ncbi:MAG: Crossover junction endodeoxyribonuclease RuvC [Candidatus Uhrbacteria bacterium GW2011_GWD2_41_121]|uniref:Crossover junction endodeoxyribonuclease RuvC n=1 Tax=Candidatus Uhrbacteria bacterium GW2011_GWC1_41_20 TaxID=1618983 RepID=A0A0G0VGG5_9BACT|nr:MAG: Crossover junction endodeoxyribonuclease RuvC [Candidatus Uhrbacteria bacterium GW2011_GWE1_39_46]KKR64452.1 MAG: Crossover junction endodeoxyribonuclease RuvC [Candidatus Uhrbacteria bacterium GW2011_GWC2_40_450]KKR90669.1 MAG: Crossover junction endodeoxyribonuclease RuvC [Candidatus Uhrbacteria bacterium GW2011_GWD2_41_121]KKR96613.1 MAG: Crossover junction endodeoxyribonuclease RuvC [Candidatus Uhrbacteria bacterium GW2011_GWD1_41_16]KKS00080.1 MAG: Crossover junction endodeoxyribon
MNKRVLGIDPGFGRCGFGMIAFDGRDWQCERHGVITTEAGLDFEVRLLEIGRDIDALIEQLKPQAVVLEELFFAKSTTTALQVAEVRGVIQYLAAVKGLEVIGVKPNEIKLAVTGYGRADKPQMQEMIKAIFHLSEVPKPDDAADALAIAWTGAQKLRF